MTFQKPTAQLQVFLLSFNELDGELKDKEVIPEVCKRLITIQIEYLLYPIDTTSVINQELAIQS